MKKSSNSVFKSFSIYKILVRQKKISKNPKNPQKIWEWTTPRETSKYLAISNIINLIVDRVWSRWKAGKWFGGKNGTTRPSITSWRSTVMNWISWAILWFSQWTWFLIFSSFWHQTILIDIIRSTRRFKRIWTGRKWLTCKLWLIRTFPFIVRTRCRD